MKVEKMHLNLLGDGLKVKEFLAHNGFQDIANYRLWRVHPSYDRKRFGDLFTDMIDNLRWRNTDNYTP